MSTRPLVSTILLLALIPPPVHAQGIVYGISNGFGFPNDNRFYQIDPTNGNLANVMPVTMPGFTVVNCYGMSAQPGTGTLYAILRASIDAPIDRRLVTINPITGVATTVGNLADAFSNLAFRSNGTLIGVVGDGGAAAESLFAISTTDASKTFLFTLGNGADGETIAFHPNGLLYHSSGFNPAVFESVDIDTQQVTPIGSTSPEMFGMGYVPTTGQLLGSDFNSQLFSINLATGARTPIGAMGDQLGGGANRAIAFVPTAVPEPATVALVLGSALAVLSYGWRRHRLHQRQIEQELTPSISS
jgi:hypothetical protein